MWKIVALFVFLLAALLEVEGDALIRKGMRGSGAAFIALGFVTLGSYGVIINTMNWNFSKLLGVYIAVFAVVSLLFSRLIFKEAISTATLIGMSLIAVGGIIIQFLGK